MSIKGWYSSNDSFLHFVSKLLKSLLKAFLLCSVFQNYGVPILLIIGVFYYLVLCIIPYFMGLFKALFYEFMILQKNIYVNESTP